MDGEPERETSPSLNLSDEPIFSGNIVKKSNPLYNSTEKLNEDYISVDPNEIIKEEPQTNCELLPPE